MTTVILTLLLLVGVVLPGPSPNAAGNPEARLPAVPASEEIPVESLLVRLWGDTGRLCLVDSATRSLNQPGPLPGRSPAIRIGEKLTYSVRYGPIRAGEATMEVTGLEDAYGHQSFHVTSRAKSNDFFDSVYRVRDFVESWMDEEHLYSRRFRKSLHEGNYRSEQDIEMDQDHRLARYQDGRVFEFAPGAHDVLSAFYYVRTLELKPGQEIWLESHADRKNYPLKVLVLGRERIKTPAGEFACLIVEPMLRVPGLFKHEGNLTIWLTEDERKMPVQMKSKISVGSITVLLTAFTRPE